MSADNKKVVSNENLAAFAEALAAKVPLKSDIPTKVSDLQNDLGFTDKQGTITSVTLNGTTTSSGGVDLGYLVVQEGGKGLSSNDYTALEKTKLGGIDTGAQVNTIETVKVNGTALVPDANKAVNVQVPTTVAELSDASDYAKTSDLEDYVLITDLEDTEEVLAAAVNDLNNRLDGLVDQYPTENSTNAVSSGGVYEAITENELVTAASLSDLNARVSDLESIGTPEETDPVFSASPAAGITAANITSWNSKVDASEYEEDSEVVASALNDLNTRISDVSNGVASITDSIPDILIIDWYFRPGSYYSGDQYVWEDIEAALQEGKYVIIKNSFEYNDNISPLYYHFVEAFEDSEGGRFWCFATPCCYKGRYYKVVLNSGDGFESFESCSLQGVTFNNVWSSIHDGTVSISESDPVFSASAAAGITASDITNWNSKTSNTGTLTGVSFNGTSATVTNGVASITASIPTEVTESTVSGWGFTKNEGTLTGVKFNNVDATVSNGVASITATIPDVANYFDEVSYDSQTKRINFKHGNTVKKYIDATDFIKDGMVDSVEIATPESGTNAGVSCLVVTFNTDAGKEDIEIPLSSIFNPSNYYTKTEIEARDLWEPGTGSGSVVLKGTNGSADGAYSVVEGCALITYDSFNVRELTNDEKSQALSVFGTEFTYYANGDLSWSKGTDTSETVYTICTDPTCTNSTATIIGKNNVQVTEGEIIDSYDTGSCLFGYLFNISSGSFSENTIYYCELERDSAPFAIGTASHAEGLSTRARGDGSHAEGIKAVSAGSYSHAEGNYTSAAGDVGSHAEGNHTVANGESSHAEGYSTLTDLGIAQHAEGFETTAKGDGSHSEGYNTIAGDMISHRGAHSEGYNTHASGRASHAEGENTFARAGAHAEGFDTHAYGYDSHAEGSGTRTGEDRETTMLGQSAHAEGLQCIAIGNHSHAEGSYTVANGENSHAEGVYTRTYYLGEHAEGTYNQSHAITESNISSSTIHTTGIGNSESNRKNAFEILNDGKIFLYNVNEYDGTNPSSNTTIQKYLYPDPLTNADFSTIFHDYEDPDFNYIYFDDYPGEEGITEYAHDNDFDGDQNFINAIVDSIDEDNEDPSYGTNCFKYTGEIFEYNGTNYWLFEGVNANAYILVETNKTLSGLSAQSLEANINNRYSPYWAFLGSDQEVYRLGEDSDDILIAVR